MPRQQRPSGDMDRLAFLRRCAGKATDDATVGIQYLTADRIAMLTSTGNALEAAMLARAQSKAVQQAKLATLKAALADLYQHLQDAWHIVNLRISHEQYPASARIDFGVRRMKDCPEPRDSAGWFALAEQVIAQDAVMVAEGHTPLSLPSAAELQATLDAARQAQQEANVAQAQANASKQALDVQPEAAVSAFVIATNDLRLGLRQLEPASRRQVMRTYGVSYRYDDDEEPDPVVEMPVTEPAAV